jgi:hypothetical protein
MFEQTINIIFLPVQRKREINACLHFLGQLTLVYYTKKND